MESTKLKNKLQELVSFVSVMTVPLITFSYRLVNAKDHAKVFMFNASRCGSIVKSRNKSPEWWSHTTSPSLNARSAKNLSQDSLPKVMASNSR